MIRRLPIWLPLLLAAPAAMAQSTTPAAPMSAAVVVRFATLPEQLGGMQRDQRNHDFGPRAPMLVYRGKDSAGPLVTVIVSDVATPATWRDAAEIGRANARQAELVQTMFEGRFSLDSAPATRGYFGDYLTKQGIKQNWIVERDGVRLTVVATIYRPEDRRKVFDAIRRELLGGITMEPVSTADTN